MATLAGIDGRSLNADAVGALSRGFGASRQVQQLGVVEQQQERQRAQDQAAQVKEARRRELLGLDAPQQQQQAIGQPQQAQPAQLGQIPESGGLPGLGAGGFEGGQPQGIGQQPQAQAPSLAESAPVNLDQFAIEFPEEAKQIADARKAQFSNTSAREQQKISSVVIGAAQAVASGDPLKFLTERRQQLTASGTATGETDEAIAAFQSGDIEGGNALLQDMVSLGQQLDILTPIKTDVLSPEALAQKSQIAAAGASSVTVGGPDEGEERKQIAKVRSRQFERVITAGENAESMVESLNQLDAIDVDTGALEPAKASFAAVIEGFGIDASGVADIDTAQSFKAASNRLVNNVLNQAKGPQTEGDAQRARSTIANLGDSPLAAQFKTDSLRAVALRTIEQRDFVESRVDAGDTFSTARAEWNKFKKQTPSLSEAVTNPQTGLPLYFYQFKNMASQRRPGISEQEIISAWRQANAK